MAFPESPRVVYERNPLESVICQLRFPPILRIESEVPARFQERIRQEYPLFRERREEAIPSIPPEIAKVLGEDLPTVLTAIGAVGNRRYELTSADESWRVTLARDFLALTSRRYRRWEDFRARLVQATDVLCQEYSPAFYVRVGLRYRDVIRKADLGVGESSWADLLELHIAGALSSRDVAAAVERAFAEITIQLIAGKVRIRHGLGQDSNVYIIDADLFTQERTEVRDALSKLDDFNREAGRLFRWAIKDRLHEAMDPQRI